MKQIGMFYFLLDIKYINLPRVLLLDIIRIREVLIDNSLYSMFNFTLSRDFKRFRANASIGFSKDGGFSSNFSISSKLGFDRFSKKFMLSPKLEAGKAIMHTQVFQDNNFNKIYDKNVDELITDVTYKINGSLFKKGTYLKGSYFYLYLEPFQKINIGIDEISLDTAVTSNGKSYNVVGVPDGVSNISFPLFPTSELEGVIKVIKNGRVLALSNVDVFFESSRGKEFTQKIKTDSEGYFYAEKLALGTYSLKLSDKVLKKLNIHLIDSIVITLKKQDDYLELEPILVDLDHHRFLKLSTYKQLYGELDIEDY